MVSWVRVVEAASKDSYFTFLRVPVTLFLIIYLGFVLRNHSTTKKADGLDNFSYISPERLRMTLRSPFNANSLSLHYVGGIALVVLVLIQKNLVPRLNRSAGIRWAHRRVLGPSILVCIGLMAFGGYALRSHSSFGEFEMAMKFFVAPWIVMFSLVGLTAWLRMPLLHALLGDAVFKACVAVPLARVLGMLLQRLDDSALRDFGLLRHWTFTDESGYYAGIFASTVITCGWAVFDAISLIARVKRSAK